MSQPVIHAEAEPKAMTNPRPLQTGTDKPFSKRTWLGCAALAIAAHAAVLIASQAEGDSQGNGLGNGELGVTVGLGQQGASDNLIKHLAPPEPVVEKQPEEKPEPKPEPKPVKKPEPKPEPVVKTPEPKPEPVVKAPVEAPKPVTQEPGYQLQQAEPEVPAEPVEETPEAVAETPVTETQDTVTEDKPQSDVSGIKRTGRADHESTGGKFGSARDYLQHVMSWLMQFHRVPVEARKSKEEGKVLVKFRFGRDGEVISREIAKSSGYATLDNAALAMFDEANPLPPVPPEFFPERDSILLSVPVEYKLTD